MKTKEEIIKEAYGDAWDKIGKHVLSSGYVESCHYPVKNHNDVDVADADDGRSYFRPKSLTGIENNNGWTKTTDSLPRDGQSIVVWYTALDGYHYPQDYEYFSDRKKWMIQNTSHWRAKIEIKPPLY